jgi:hypothetical protein
LLVDERQVKLEDKIQTFLNDKVKISSLGQNTTILHLATHLSGFPSLPNSFIAKMTDERNPYKELVTQDLYNYLRTCQFLNIYYKYLCQLEMAACEPQPDVRAQLEELRLIKSFHDAAKAKAEHCDDVTAAMELFNYARRRLSRFGKDCC